MQREMNIRLPDDVYVALRMNADELKDDLLQKAAIQYFIENKLSLDRAAAMCGLSRLEFINILYHENIPFYPSPPDSESLLYRSFLSDAGERNEN